MRSKFLPLLILIFSATACQTSADKLADRSLQSALATPHPIHNTKISNEVITGTDGTRYSLASYDSQNLCFWVQKPANKTISKKLNFRLYTYEKAKQPLAKTNYFSTNNVKLIDSFTKKIKKNVTAPNLIRNSAGKVIATPLSPIKTTNQSISELKLCFSASAINENTSYLVLRSLDDQQYGDKLFVSWKLIK